MFNYTCMMKMIRTIIIDDERSARLELKRILSVFPDIQIIGEAANADEAELIINELIPDLIFLDVQMPGRSGFELLESLAIVPLTIFVTAYDKYAFKAFEVSAIDYLLKPVREERLTRTILQVRERLKQQTGRSLFIKEGNRYYFIQWTDVSLIESAHQYVRLYTANGKPLLKNSLKQIEEQLPPNLFFRANRWQLINLQFISECKTVQGILHVRLSDEQEIIFSERQSTLFRKTHPNL